MSGWVAGAIVVGGIAQGIGASRAGRSQEAAGDKSIAEQREAREQFFARTQPFVDFGLEARDELRNLLFDPTAGLDEINPIVDILRNQGFEAIQESAAAGGRLGAGGTLKDLTQFNTDLTTTVIPQLQNQRFNQLFSVLGLGQNAAVGQGSAALSTANQISNFQQGIGRAGANTAINQTNAFTNTLGNFSQFAGQFGNQNTLTPSNSVATTNPNTLTLGVL